MKKIRYVFLLFVFLILLSSCQKAKTYEDLRNEFETHLEETKANNIEKINKFNDLTTLIYSSVVKIDLVNKHGTGVVFQYDETHYYVLTNAHLVCVNSCRKEAKVFDVFNNPYDFEVIDYSFKYDLAIIKIEKSKELNIINFSNLNISENNEVIIIGFHGAQKNAVTYGKVVLYDVIEFNEDDNIEIKFPTMISSNPVKHGSSGSVVINNDGLLVGLLYAGSFDNSNVARYAFSIPVERIIEYLNKNDFVPQYKEDLS